MDASTCSSLGAMAPLLRKLDLVMAQGNIILAEVKNEVEHLIQGIKKINTSLTDLSLTEDPPFMFKLWMNEVRELYSDMEDYLDQVMHSGADADAKARTAGRSGLVKISHLYNVKLKRRPPMATKILEFRARVQEACERHERYGLVSLTFKRRFVSYGPSFPARHVNLIDHGPMDKLANCLAPDDGEEEHMVVSNYLSSGQGVLARQHLPKGYIRSIEDDSSAGLLYEHLRIQISGGFSPTSSFRFKSNSLMSSGIPTTLLRVSRNICITKDLMSRVH
uniref:Disease resistance N-terminal domain-containing protein n=1 Tax=Arundo donax TaxID=35708 RepID=A0A0A9FG82_ARUDO